LRSRAMTSPAPSTTEIRAGTQVVTLINIFEVAPDRQAELVQLLERTTDEVMRHQPGFISSNIHRGLDGTRVANYAQWSSREAFDAMLANPDARREREALAKIGKGSPFLY